MEIMIRVDTNDGDYIEETNKITQKNLDKIKPLIKAIKNFKKDYNYPYGECCDDDKDVREMYDFDEEIFDLFENYTPSYDYGFHTIKRIEVFPLREKQRLL